MVRERFVCKKSNFPHKPFFARINNILIEGDTVGQVYSKLEMIGKSIVEIRVRRSGKQLLSSDFKKEE